MSLKGIHPKSTSMLRKGRLRDDKKWAKKQKHWIASPQGYFQSRSARKGRDLAGSGDLDLWIPAYARMTETRISLLTTHYIY
jgi:hypothetical protein